MFVAVKRHKVVTAIAAFIVAALAVFGVMAVTGNGPGYHAPQNGNSYNYGVPVKGAHFHSKVLAGAHFHS